MCISSFAFAHPGRTDSRGGHKDNKNKSGLGSYHYHCGGYPAHLHTNGVCPYSYTEEEIFFQEEESNDNEYEVPKYENESNLDENKITQSENQSNTSDVVSNVIDANENLEVIAPIISKDDEKVKNENNELKKEEPITTESKDNELKEENIVNEIENNEAKEETIVNETKNTEEINVEVGKDNSENDSEGSLAPLLILGGAGYLAYIEKKKYT